MESNDSPEIPDRGETSDIPGHPSGARPEPSPSAPNQHDNNKTKTHCIHNPLPTLNCRAKILLAGTILVHTVVQRTVQTTAKAWTLGFKKRRATETFEDASNFSVPSALRGARDE